MKRRFEHEKKHEKREIIEKNEKKIKIVESDGNINWHFFVRRQKFQHVHFVYYYKIQKAMKKN